MAIDFKSMRDAFYAMDTSNSGLITIDQIKSSLMQNNYIT